MIKTIIETDAEIFDNHVNAFMKSNKVKDIQTHILRNEGMMTQFIAVIIYKARTELIEPEIITDAAVYAKLEKRHYEAEEEYLDNAYDRMKDDEATENEA